MEQYQKDAIREVIEALIVELGVDNVPAELDVDGALALLKPAEEATDASQEEVADAEVEA